LQQKITQTQQKLDEQTSKPVVDNTPNKREQYNNAIALADKALADGDFDRAISKYQEAQTLLPNENYPHNQIAVANQRKQDLANQNLQNQNQLKYQQTITRADNAFAQKNYQEAEAAYQQALSIKPADSYATSRINEIKRIVAENLNKQNQQQQQQVVTNPVVTPKVETTTTSTTQSKADLLPLMVTNV
jgi:tetratricopeptide (TPR) repeat protein